MEKKRARPRRSTRRERSTSNTPYRELRQAAERVLVIHAPKTLTFAEISGILARKGLRFAPRTLQLVLTDYRAIRPRSRQTSAPAPQRQLLTELKLSLYRLEVDAVELRDPGHSQLHLRVDKVLDAKRPFWLSAWLPTHPSVTPDQQWHTLQDWRLPLVPLSAEPWTTPKLGVLRLATVEEAASLINSLVGTMTDDAELRPLLGVEECLPAEANRRIELNGLILRKRRVAQSRSLPESTCLRCGLPLSDPTSVSIGLGPECRKNLSEQAIKDLRSKDPRRRFLVGARRPHQWLETIARRYRPPAGPSGQRDP